MNARVTAYANVGPVELRVEDCPSCGVVYAITTDYEKRRRSDGKSWNCPNGHWISYGKNDTQRLHEAEARETHLRDQLEASAREAEKVRGALLRDRQRFANGVCPCCNRYFAKVHQHMTTQHPDYDVTKVKVATTEPVKFACTCGKRFDTLRGLHVHQGHSRTPDWATAGSKQWHGGHLTVV